MYADVIIDISHEALDRTFQYIIPKDMESVVSTGSVCHVPFGKSNSLKKAYVVGISEVPQVSVEKLKEIANIDERDVSIEGQLITLAFWMAKRFGATFASCLRSVLPIAKKASLPEKKTVSLAVSEYEVNDFLVEFTNKKRYSIAKERLLRELLNEGSLPWEVITGKLNIASSNIRELEKKGMVNVCVNSTHYEYDNKLGIKKKEVELNPEQMQAIDTFVSDWKNKIRSNYLVFGVTGSGKTEVYIRMLERVIEDGKDAIVLIPEIALTYQTLMRFYHRFGDVVSVMNSRLTQAERYDIFQRAKSGEIKIIVGPRSALFTPFNNLGLIIIDEEHETSYKSEKMPRYHAKDVAIKRAELSGASVVLGSATPSIESYYNALKGEFKLLKLSNRAGNAVPSECEIVDLRKELKNGNRSIISIRLQELIRKNLKKNKQTMLFLNRRGMLGSVSCRSCGEVIKCPHCDVSLSLHRDKRLHCHYCGYSIASPKQCPSCGSPYIGGFKAGTEKTEEEVAKLFPNARILRMDADSTKGKDGHEKILSIFANRGADILIGTQMIVKGHDFPDVSLVGILAADLSLNTTDYRASERTFDLITQAAGRAGRGDTKGRVVIQTYRPDHYSVELAATQNYEAFFEKEIRYRRLLSYPPIGHLLLVMILSRKEAAAVSAGEQIEKSVSGMLNGVWMSNVVSPSISKIQDIHRRMIYFKVDNIEKIADIREQVDSISDKLNDVSIYYDTDPMSM